ncbi:hypothetical protein NEFER03_0038 [Nematocida sp. LUAm3]|nr:hypothetical protein NEFER03_0038 [Nematocida sp. LUAm3]KAI5176254.1 hypothetical protein NEFER02_2051 [Nematocida sp. LUAm2]KAI5176712.1 hypothetical protein NEFER01_0037 [Nematocida sp. LUAm1]
MTLLVDTYEIPAHTIMFQLYKVPCYEVHLEEVYNRSYNAPKNGKKYTVLKDICQKTLLTVRDVESVVYIIHSEILSEKEFRMLRYYTNELIYVENGMIKVVNKRTKKTGMYQVDKRKDVNHRVTHLLTKVDSSENISGNSQIEKLSEEQRREKASSLPFLRAQSSSEVYFPDGDLSEDSDILEEQEDCT